MTSPSGYTAYEFDAVVKFGGSLLADLESADSATKAIEAAAAEGHAVIVLPGGGPTDNTIEGIDELRRLQPLTHHRACALAQDQTGLVICDRAFSTLLVPCDTISEARTATGKGLVPVLLPSRLIEVVDPFEKSWEITSDGMAVWLAWLLGIHRTAILTNVDGIYPPEGLRTGPPVREIDAPDLIKWGQTAVDVCVPRFIADRGGFAWVGNGAFEDRLTRALSGLPTVGTTIRAR